MSKMEIKIKKSPLDETYDCLVKEISPKAALLVAKMYAEIQIIKEMLEISNSSAPYSTPSQRGNYE